MINYIVHMILTIILALGFIYYCYVVDYKNERRK